MKNFANLFARLDETNKTNEKVKFLQNYFEEVSDADKINTLALFTGRRPKRQISSTLLRNWAVELAEIPEWLFEESYQVVGDLAETMALLLPPGNSTQHKNLSEWMQEIRGLAKFDEEQKKEFVVNAWNELDSSERFVFNKLLTGGFRIGVSQSLLIKAISNLSGIEATTLTHRIMGNWNPETFDFAELIAQEDGSTDSSRPYPFFLAYSIDEEKLGLQTESEDILFQNPEEWQAEWKWDGIRAQLIKRNDELFIWSRGEELVTDKFPELHNFLKSLPNGTVIDGEIVTWRDGKPMSFNTLQTRIGRKNLTKKILADNPVSVIAYDCLEINGKDIRSESLIERRQVLESFILNNKSASNFYLSKIIEFENWKHLGEIRAGSRDELAEGIMLKRKSSTYQVGRRRGDWWKWKVDPMTVDGVLIYAQKGHGRRADLYTDYTFAVWDGDKLVPFAKAYSGLTDKEIAQVDYFIKRNTLERFGPVRTVKPELVFELGFEGISESTRHKSGIALRFPRILRWRKDKPKEEADTIETLRAMLGG